jgi:hypothetical protein
MSRRRCRCMCRGCRDMHVLGEAKDEAKGEAKWETTAAALMAAALKTAEGAASERAADDAQTGCTPGGEEAAI